MAANPTTPPRTLRAANTAPPSPGAAIKVDVEGVGVAVFNIAGKLFAIEARCPHAGGPLQQGRLHDTVVECPWHGSQFDLATGEVRHGPAHHGVHAYAVRSEGPDLIFEPRGA